MTNRYFALASGILAVVCIMLTAGCVSSDIIDGMWVCQNPDGTVSYSHIQNGLITRANQYAEDWVNVYPAVEITKTGTNQYTYLNTKAVISDDGTEMDTYTPSRFDASNIVHYHYIKDDSVKMPTAKV